MLNLIHKYINIFFMCNVTLRIQITTIICKRFFFNVDMFGNFFKEDVKGKITDKMN